MTEEAFFCDRQVIWFVLILDIGSICLEYMHLIWCFRFINRKLSLQARHWIEVQTLSDYLKSHSFVLAEMIGNFFS